MLTTDLELSEKLPVTWDLRSAIEDAPRGQVPDLARVFDERGAEGDNSLARARDELLDTVTDAVTRSFRPAFGIAAVLAALAAIPTVIVVGRSPHGRRVWPARRRRVSAIGIGALVDRRRRPARCRGGRGAWSVGEFTAEDPCTAGPDPYPGDGLDAAAAADRPVDAERRGVRAGHHARAARAVARREQRLRRRAVGRGDPRAGPARSAPTGPSTTPTTATRSPAGPPRRSASWSTGPRSAGSSSASRSGTESVLSPQVPPTINAVRSGTGDPGGTIVPSRCRRTSGGSCRR